MLNLEIILFSVIVGIAGALLGLFYRNCLKPPNMIFSSFFDILDSWVNLARSLESNNWVKFRGNWIAMVIGYCMYCTTTWITIALYLIVLGFNIWLILAMGVQHVLIVAFCKYLLSNNPDLSYLRLEIARHSFKDIEADPDVSVVVGEHYKWDNKYILAIPDHNSDCGGCPFAGHDTLCVPTECDGLKFVEVDSNKIKK